MKKFLLLFLIIPFISFGQDTTRCDEMILKDGDIIMVIVKEVGIDLIKYKKCKNLEGPIYSILKSNVFLIKYINGTKDVFNISKTNSNPKEVKIQKRETPQKINKAKSLTLENGIINLPLETYSFTKHTPKRDKRYVEYRNGVKHVIDAQSITYFGVDLSEMKLTNPEKYGKEEKLNLYIEAWEEGVYNKIKNIKFKNLFKKTKRDFKFKESLFCTSELNDNKSSPWISNYKYEMSIEDIVKKVKSYELDEDKGLGFVMIVENFNKIDVKTSVYYTFFDINTREIIWSIRIIMNPTGVTMTGFWSGGIKDTFIIFKEKVYQKELPFSTSF